MMNRKKFLITIMCLLAAVGITIGQNYDYHMSDLRVFRINLGSSRGPTTGEVTTYGLLPGTFVVNTYDDTVYIVVDGSNDIAIGSNGTVTVNGLVMDGLTVNGSVDVNISLTNSTVRIDQTNAVGTPDVPLVMITDARAGATANTAGEATLVIKSSGTQALSSTNGIITIHDEIECAGDMTLDPAGGDVICDATVDATAYKADAGSGIDVESTGALDIGNTTATSIDYGNTNVTAHMFTTDGTGTAEIVLPDESIGNAEIAALDAAKLTAATVASAIDINACTNLDMANLAAGTTAAAFDGSAITALNAANISAGTVLSAVDASAVTNLGVYAEPELVTETLAAGSLFSTNNVTLVDLDGNTMTGNAMVHVWQSAAAGVAMTFPDGVENEVVAAEENYWVGITNAGTLIILIEESGITTNDLYVSVGPRVATTNILLLP